MSARRAIVRSPNLVGFLLKEKVLFLFWPKYGGGGNFPPGTPISDGTVLDVKVSSLFGHTLIKTFTENWDSKAPSVGTLLAY